MKTIRAELHVHTCLSPCAEVEMIPPLIVQKAVEFGIELIGITDHNASANVAAVMRAAQGSGLTVLPGMEVQTQEEVHVLCLFDELEALLAWQQRVDGSLPPLQNKPDFFGEQFVVDETGDFLRREERLLLTSTDLSLGTVINEVAALGGLAIPAHVDRKAFGLLANLGFVPPQPRPEALEISRLLDPRRADQEFPQVKGYPLIQSGDAHRLEELLGANYFEIESATLAEIRMALKAEQGRMLRLVRFH